MVRRLLSLLVVVAVAAAIIHFYGWPTTWSLPDAGELIGMPRPTPAASIAPEALPTYTREVAGKAWFRRYFTRLAFSDARGPNSYTGQITKWTRQRVRIDILNDGGPGMDAYVKSLVSRLNRVQRATRFRVVNGDADITIEYLSHAEYVRHARDGSVGTCETRFYRGSRGLQSAAIKIDASVLKTAARRKPAVIHELTHALGFRGHLRAADDATRSVLYYAPALSTWSQNDGAAIRIMYSSAIKSGMNVTQVRKALKELVAE